MTFILMKTAVQRFSLVLAFCLFAGNGKAQNVDDNFSSDTLRISLSTKNIPIHDAIESVAAQAKVSIGWSKDRVELNKPISVDLKDVTVEKALEIILRDTDARASFSKDGKTIIISRESTHRSSGVNQEVSQLAGTVKDSATGKPVAGASLRIRGTNLMGRTDESGQYIIKGVPRGDHAIEVRAVGYKLAVRNIVLNDARVLVNISINAAATTLNEVVTTVTGMQRKIEIGNDVTTINADSVLKTAPITSVTELLEGRVPGLTVTKTSGVPGAPSRIRLRGIGGGLVNGVEGAATNDPIVIVDGIRINATQSGVTDQNLAPDRVELGARTYGSEYPVQSAIDQIDPNSIERIDVYKGPSAAALYGSDAANGVIVITTKKGKSGPARWSIAMAQGIEYLSGSYAKPGYYVFCSSRGVGFVTPEVCGFNTNWDLVRVDSVVRFQALDNPSLTQFSTGGRGEQSANVSGGQGMYAYSITGTRSSELGVLKMPQLYRQQFITLYDSAPGGWMTRPNRLNSNSVTSTFSIEPARDMLLTFTGRLTGSHQQQSSGQLQLAELASQYIDTLSIDIGVLAGYATKVNARRSTADYSAALRWTPLHYLPINATIGNSRDNRKDSRLIPYGLGRNELGSYSTGTAVQDTRTARINTTLWPQWKLSTAIGIEVTSNERSQFQGMNDSLQQGIGVPTALYRANQGYIKTTTGGWFIEPRLNLNSRFFVNPGFRFDGNTLSGSKGGLWSLFPRLNFSWLAVDGGRGDGWLRNVSMLRPRVSFGVAGVQPAPGMQLRLLNEVSPSEDILRHGLRVGTIGNTGLHPEKTREIEGGFDLELYDGRYSLSISQFQKVRRDAIEQILLPPSVYGTANQYVNIGEIKNTGIELSLSAVLLEYQLLRWQINASLSRYNNKLVKLNSEEAYIDLGDGSRYMAGYPLNGRWERPILGYSPTANGRLKIDDVMVGDSAVYVGQQAPNFDLPVAMNFALLNGAMGINLGFHYKDGMTQLNTGSEQHLANIFFNPMATPTEQAIAVAARGCSSGGFCSRYGLVQTVNVFRFNSLSVSYNVPRNYTQRYGVPSVQFAVQGSNLGLWTNYRGKDPEVNSNTVGEATVDNGQIPQSRTWRIQIRFGN